MYARILGMSGGTDQPGICQPLATPFRKGDPPFFLQVLVNDCTFNNNRAGFGGAICLDVEGITNITRSSFTANRAETSGAAVYADGSSSVNISLTKLTGNSAVGSGGAVALFENAVADIRNCSCSGNSARVSAGCILLESTGVSSELASLTAA
jgi:predicted outer membrane repeat protein